MKRISVFNKMAILTLLATSAVSVAPKQSHAIMGAVAFNIPMLVIGGGVMAGGMLVNYYGFDNDNEFFSIVGGATAIVGLVLLDDQNRVSPQFTALDSPSAAALNINSEEMTAYNSELPQVNTILQTISGESLKYNQPTTSTKDLAGFAAQEWTTYGQLLSPGTQSALAKVQANFRTQLNQTTRNTR